MENDDVLKIGDHVECPLCKTKVAIISAGQWGGLNMGHHRVKHYFNKTQFISVTCAVGGELIENDDVCTTCGANKTKGPSEALCCCTGL